MRPISEILTRQLYIRLSEDQLSAVVDKQYVEKVEAVIGCKLPEDYAEFLRDYPYTGLLNVREEEGFRDTVIHGIDSWDGARNSLYPSGAIFAQSTIETSDLLYWSKAIRPEHKTWLIIADTDIGATYNMSISRENFGKIYYSPSDIVSGEEPLIALSFTDFINRIIEVR
jgi:SMI1 / KNR4 family (SUKH-1)